MDLIDMCVCVCVCVCITFYPKAAKYIFLSSAHGTFSRTDHRLGHKTSLNKFKKTEIISSIFSYRNAMGLEINLKKKTAKKHKYVQAKQYVLNNQWVTEEIKAEILKIPGNK